MTEIPFPLFPTKLRLHFGAIGGAFCLRLAPRALWPRSDR
jgi:hypothetical protein